MSKTMLSCLAILLASNFAVADEPAVVLRVKGLAGLISDFRVLAKRAGREEQAKMLEGMLQSRTGPKGLEGVDTSKPFGLTIEPKAKLTESRIWLLLPLADEKVFLKFLDTLGMKPTRQADGTYKVALEGVPVFNTGLFRIAHGYLYGTIKLSDASAIPPADKLPKAETLLGDSNAVLSLAIHIDRVPDSLRKLAVSFLGLQLGAAKDKKPDDETKAQAALREATIDETTARMKALVMEGKTLRADLSLDTRKDELALSAVLVGQKGAGLARDIAALGSLPSAVAGLLGKDCILGGTIRLELPPALRKAAAGVIDESMKNALDQLQAHERELAEPVVKAIAPTLRMGLLDAAFQMRGSKSGKVVLVAAMQVKDGAKIEQAIKKLLGSLPEDSRKGVKADAARAGKVNIHSVTFKSKDAKTKALLGDGPAFFALRGDGLYLALGDEALAALKAALEAKPGTVPGPLTLEGSLEKFSPLFPLLYPDLKKAPEAAKQAFKDSSGMVRLVATGGERLEVRFSVQTAAITFAGLLDKLRK